MRKEPDLAERFLGLLRPIERDLEKYCRRQTGSALTIDEITTEKDIADQSKANALLQSSAQDKELSLHLLRVHREYLADLGAKRNWGRLRPNGVRRFYCLALQPSRRVGEGWSAHIAGRCAAFRYPAGLLGTRCPARCRGRRNQRSKSRPSLER
ncbi:MAG: hypothetical protein L0Z50_13405 [Verrucomicrobiales bacterium]|nr:hypothetical protein [Verrucomicrobiales bacterium]